MKRTTMEEETDERYHVGDHYRAKKPGIGPPGSIALSGVGWTDAELQRSGTPAPQDVTGAVKTSNTAKHCCQCLGRDEAV